MRIKYSSDIIEMFSNKQELTAKEIYDQLKAKYPQVSTKVASFATSKMVNAKMLYRVKEAHYTLRSTKKADITTNRPILKDNFIGYF